MFKFILILIISFNYSFAGFEKIKIGKIDPYYSDKITFTQLENIINEIEQLFEDTLSYEVFDYGYTGKPIHLKYLKPNMLQKRIKRKTASLNRKISKLKSLEEYFPSKKKEINALQKKYDLESNRVNNLIKNYNSFVEEANQKEYSKNEYNKMKNIIENKKRVLKNEQKEKRRLERKLRRETIKYNNRVLSFKNLVRQTKYLSKELESLNKNNKIVKGRTFGKKEILLKTITKNGKNYKQKLEKNTMDKIEIYNFDSIAQLKVIIAHEIAHLVGIPHINVKNALMHPILQKSQIDSLTLTTEDIKNFNKHF